jgi:dephospho-CoA kinase
VRRIAVAGGIGAGKSAVTARLAALGWPVVDADQIARSVTAHGTGAWQALRDAFGDAVLDGDGEIDRAFLAEVVFHDPSALARLNRITHAPIGVEMARQLDALSGPAAFVAIPLFRPEHRAALSLDAAWAVQASRAVALDRLCRLRGFREADALARLDSQMSNDELAGIVDRVIWNEGTLQELYDDLDAVLAEEGLSRG